VLAKRVYENGDPQVSIFAVAGNSGSSTYPRALRA
jgi:hypothetical protein